MTKQGFLKSLFLQALSCRPISQLQDGTDNVDPSAGVTMGVGCSLEVSWVTSWNGSLLCEKTLLVLLWVMPEFTLKAVASKN